VAAYLVSHAITGYLRMLESITHSAAVASLHDERVNLVHRGQEYLALGNELVNEIGDEQHDQRLDSFVRLLANERDSDRSLVDTEALHSSACQLLETMCTAAHDDWPRYDKAIASMLWEYGKDLSWSIETSATLRRPMRNAAREELSRRLERTAGLEGVFDIQLSLMGQIFLDPADSFWNTAPARFSPPHSIAIQENARYALHEIIYRVKPGSDEPLAWEIFRHQMERAPAGTLPARIRQFLTSAEPMHLVWDAYVGGPTPVATVEVDQTRWQLLALGVSETAIAS
jgi:hypothetical protein